MSRLNEAMDEYDRSVQVAIDRGEIIGGAYDAEAGRIVPVSLHWLELEGPAAQDYDLGEYRTADGKAIALIASVRPGRHTREWRLTDAAGADGYEEVEIPVASAGSGAVHHRGRSGVETVYTFGRGLGQPHVQARAGESFMFAADSDQQIGAMVLSFVTRAFKDDYEVIVQPSSSEMAQ